MNEPQEIDGDQAMLQLEWEQSGTLKRNLSQAVRVALKNRELSPRQVMNLGAFLWLVERLPEHHGKYTGRIETSVDYGDGAGWMMVTISRDGLILDEGEIIRSEYGSDHPSKTVFRAGSSGLPDYEMHFDLHDWLRDFVNDAGDPNVAFSIDWHPENEMPPAKG